MSSRYETVKTIEESNEHILLQLGKALYSIDSERSICKEFADLPAVNVPYVIVEAENIQSYGLSGYDVEVYYDEVNDVYKEVTVMYQQQDFTITAAYDNPNVFLQKFKLKRSSSDFAYTYFTSEDIGINTVSNISDVSLPVESGGDWEIRKQLTITLNYMTKEEVEVNTIETITGSTTTSGTDDEADVTEDFSVSYS